MKRYRGEGLLFLITCFKLGRCCNLSRTTTTTTHERFIVVLLSLSQVSTNFLSLQKKSMFEHIDCHICIRNNLNLIFRYDKFFKHRLQKSFKFCSIIILMCPINGKFYTIWFLCSLNHSDKVS